MEINEVLEKLGEDERAFVLEHYDAKIKSEKILGIEAARKKGQDVNGFRSQVEKLNGTLKAVGIDPAGNLEEQIENFKNRLDKMSRESEGGDSIAKGLQKQIAEITKKLEASAKTEEEARRKYTSAKISESLSKAFGDSIYGVDLAVKDLLSSGRVKLRDDESVVFVNGNDELDLSEGVETFKKSRPDLVKNNQRPGGASAPHGTKQNKTMPLIEFNKLSGKQRSEFVRSGGLPTD